MATDVQTATPETFDAQTQGPSSELVVTYFWGPDCPNCEVFAADLPGLLDGLPENVRLVKVNAYQYPELAQRFAIFGIPSFVLFKGGQKLGMMREYYGRGYWTAVVEEKAAGP